MAEAAPSQVFMEQHDEKGSGGASAENTQALCMGNCYNAACIPCAMCGCSSNLFTVQQGYVGVVTEFGKYERTLPPGRHKYNIMSEALVPVNLKVCCLDVPPQELLSADNLTIRIDAVCYYKVFDAQKAIFAVDNYKYALSNLAQVTVRTVLGENTLAELFAKRQSVNARLQELIDVASDPWGIKVSRVEIKDIRMDPKMVRAMAAKAEANQIAEAKIIQSRAQRDAAEILSEAASNMKDNPASLKLQWFETLRLMATQGNNQVIIIPEHMNAGSALAAKTAGGMFGGRR